MNLKRISNPELSIFKLVHHHLKGKVNLVQWHHSWAAFSKLLKHFKQICKNFRSSPMKVAKSANQFNFIIQKIILQLIEARLVMPCRSIIIVTSHFILIAWIQAVIKAVKLLLVLAWETSLCDSTVVRLSMICSQSSGNRPISARYACFSHSLNFQAPGCGIKLTWRG